MSSYRSSSTNYPSALGSSTNYPSALGSRDLDLGLSSGTRSSLLSSGLDKGVSSLTSSLRTDPLLKYNSPLANTGSSSSSSAYKSSEYSSVSSSSSAVDGGRPRHETHSDSTYRSRTVGESGIPHTSYAHNSSSSSSDRPYKNNVSSFSYNI